MKGVRNLEPEGVEIPEGVSYRDHGGQWGSDMAVLLYLFVKKK